MQTLVHTDRAFIEQRLSYLKDMLSAPWRRDTKQSLERRAKVCQEMLDELDDDCSTLDTALEQQVRDGMHTMTLRPRLRT